MPDLRLTPTVHLDHLRTESRRFRDALAGTDPAAPVPSCPAWTAADLAWHLGPEVQDFWAGVVADRPAAPAEREAPPRAPAYDAVLAGFDAAHDRLVSELAAALEHGDADAEAWSWAEEHTVSFLARRQALEALVHRVDAEQTAGLPSVIDPHLAADGVEEVLDVMYGATPSWGLFTPGPGLVRVDLTDVDDVLWVRLGTFDGTRPEDGRSYTGESDLSVVPAPGESPDLVVGGTAADLLCWLWQRGPASAVTVDAVTGQGPATRETLAALVSAPID